jgi:phage terminase large subunit GpA-like protein
MAEAELQYPLRPAERRILAKRTKLPPSKWAEQERYLRRGARSGPWRNSANPVGALVMDLLGQSSVRVGVIAKGSQTGMSDAVYNILGREIDYSTGSDAALVVLADEKSVKKHAKKRIIPMLEDSTSLKQIMSKNPDDTTIYSVQLATGATIEIGWATSQVSLASEAYRWVVMDEIGKYTNTTNIKEAEVRTATYEKFGKKIIKLGAPTDAGCPIDDALEECDVIYDVAVPCPECGAEQIMQFGQFRWPGQKNIDGTTEADPRAIRRQRSAWYECEHCQARWDDYARDRALHHASLQPRHEVDFPYAVGVHVPAWVTPFRSMSDCVAEWLEAQDRPEALKAWYNNWAGLSFSNIAEEDLTTAEVLHARKHQWWPDGAKWRVPKAAVILTAACDIQDNRLEAAVFAWGPRYESWTLDRQIFPGSPSEPEVWQQLDEYLSRSWLHESGHYIHIAAAGVDTGGHHTQEAYRFLRKRLTRKIFGVKGASQHDAPLASLKWPHKKSRREVPLLLVGTVRAKNDLHAFMQVEDHGPGFMHHPHHFEYDWFEQLTAEKPVEQRDKWGNKKRWWVPKKAGIRNEAIDLMVYAYAVLHYTKPDWHSACEELALELARPVPAGQEQKPQKPKPKPKPVVSQATERTLPSWFR